LFMLASVIRSDSEKWNWFRLRILIFGCNAS
jgi:hypothetical protein